MDPKELWQTALGELEVTLSKANFTTWFKDTLILSINDKEIIIGVPNGFTQKWLENKYHPQIAETLKKLFPGLKKVSYKVSSQDSLPFIQPKLDKDNVETTPPPRHHQLNPKYIFEKFIIGNSNRLAAATSQAVSLKPGLVYNPLFIYGGVGLGKTHLIQAIGNEILGRFPKKKVIYVSCEGFTNDFVSSITSGKINQFKKTYRDVDIFLVDDIQFLSGKEGTQEEFFHTFNTLHQNDRQIVITSDRVPQAIPQIQQRLTSRLGMGMVADVQSPNLEMREAILRSKSQEKNFPMEDDVITFIAQRIESNIRDLEGAINRLATTCQLNRLKPSLDNTSKILGDIIDSKGKNLSTEKILKVVSEFFQIEPKELLSPKRNRDLVWPRQIMMYLLRHEMNLSYPKIGQGLNKKDHTTIMYGVEKIAKEIAVNSELKKNLTIIKEKLYIV